MLGRTHFFVGIAAALAIQQPQTFPVLVAGTGAAAIGGVIPDIDSSSSEAHRSADEAILVSVLAVIAVIVADRVFHAGIYEKIRSDSSMERVVIGIALFLAVCAFGSRQPHRAFMHSFVALLLFTWCVSIILPAAAPYFATAFGSHMVIDAALALKAQVLPSHVRVGWLHQQGAHEHRYRGDGSPSCDVRAGEKCAWGCAGASAGLSDDPDCGS